ncbi:MAG: hypothetical protein ACQEWG_16840 [Bacteroidota bacterium]
MPRVLLMILVLGLFFISCKENTGERDIEEQDIRLQAESEIMSDEVYRARISSLNEDVNQGRNVSGNVTLEIQGDELQITVEVSGLEPNMQHLQHLHGSKEGAETTCPDSSADKNDDGVVDITEATQYAGITMIPFHDDPVSMTIKTHSYPNTDAEGNLKYRQTVNLESLRMAFKNKFGWEELDFSRFTYMVHGVKEGSLPKTAGSVMDVPANVTVPVGCAKITKESL